MTNNAITDYLQSTSPDEADAGFLGYLSALTEMAKVAPQVARSIVQELADQRANLKLIASENYCSLATQLAMGNLLTDKYAEGYPGHRFYAGCDNVDEVEAYACEQLKQLFGCDHAYVQP
ncbi:MAG: glycine hydroxymethyltransferase, partial [Candidatus Hydrogenedentota bacterium]